jgi:hypothetical protein
VLSDAITSESKPQPKAQRAVNPILRRIVSTCSKVPGVAAIGLGGSRSIRTGDVGSDYDVIIFSDGDVELDHAAMRETVAALGGEMRTSRNKPGESLLGEMYIDGTKVELFFRRIPMIAGEIARAREGKFSRVFNPLHVVGFVSTITISYATYVVPLWDPQGKLKRLVASAYPYPEALREQMLKTFRSEAKIALNYAGKARSVEDAAHLAALYGRVIAAWGLVLFAANRRYPVIDKGGRRLVAALPNSPANYVFRTNSVIRAIGAGDLTGAFEEANRLNAEVMAIARTPSAAVAAELTAEGPSQA